MGSQDQSVTMYTVAKGPAAIINKTRRGKSKPLESLDQANREPDRGEVVVKKDEENLDTIVFLHPVKMRNQRGKVQQQENISPDHREIVTFITQGWDRVKSEMNLDTGNVHYYEERSNPVLSGFEPFDLDAWWGRKVYQNLTSGI